MLTKSTLLVIITTAFIAIIALFIPVRPLTLFKRYYTTAMSSAKGEVYFLSHGVRGPHHFRKAAEM